jgi:hypothetical protein
MKFLVLIVLTLFTFSCATNQLIQDKEYSNSLALYKQSEFENAALQFPEKEKNGFITSVEKAWLSLWNKKGDNSKLESQIKSLDQRQYTSLSKEADFFFFNETADGYIPAEHEVISMHLINSMIYMQQKKWTDAEVEARRASYFLQKLFNPDQPHFDDPALRLWLAAIWMSLNKWNEAQVDLRKIFEITKNKDIKKLSEQDRAPAFFRLLFRGSGPELKWSPNSVMPEFSISINSDQGFNSQAWYDRHLKRNTAIRDTVLKSNYMAQYLGIKTNSTTQKALGTTFGVATQLIGVIVGGAIIVGGIYLASQSGGVQSGDALGSIFGAGLLVGGALLKSGNEMITTTRKEAHAYEDREFEKIRTYRFVRFLPNFFSYEISPFGSQTDLSNKINLSLGSTQVEYVLNPL